MVVGDWVVVVVVAMVMVRKVVLARNDACVSGVVLSLVIACNGLVTMASAAVSVMDGLHGRFAAKSEWCELLASTSRLLLPRSMSSLCAWPTPMLPGAATFTPTIRVAHA